MNEPKTDRAWEEGQKRIGETAKQVAAILAQNGVTYNEVPPIFGKAKSLLVISATTEELHLVCPQCGKSWHHKDALFCSECGQKLEQGAALD